MLQVLLHTPVWVWALLALIVWLGWRDLRARTSPPARLAILPAVATSVWLINSLSATTPTLSIPAWLLTLAAAAPLGALIASRRHLEVAPGQRLMWLAGSRFSMGLGLTVFCVRYAMGVAVARDPSLASDATWIIAANVVGGAVAGVGLGWLTCLLFRYQRAARAGDLRPTSVGLMATT